MQTDTLLSTHDLQAFANDGFLVKTALFTGQQINQISRWANELMALPEVPGKYMMYFEQSRKEPGKRLLARIENFYPYHEGFRELLDSPKMLGCVAELFGEPAVLFKDKINFKLPGGDGFKAHQDVQAGWDMYAHLHITAMVTIDSCNTENGCLEIAAAQHNRGLIGKTWDPLTETESSRMEFIPCLTEPGDTVFFDSYAPHRSSPNMSPFPRRVLYVTYNKHAAGDHRSEYYADKRKSYPPDCERIPGKQYTYKV